MSMEVNVQENWTVEPELTELPPRRIVRSEFPDLNRPNPMLMYGAGGALAVGGVVLLIAGLNVGTVLYTILGILITLGGAGIIGFLGPYLTQRYLARGEHLVKNGAPVMARILSAENMSGDYRFGRSVTYQVSLPNGDMVHKHVNADDRLLPRKIPANATALLDVESNDVELYCALPYRVPVNPAMAARTPAADGSAVGGVGQTPTAATGSGRMGTIDVAEVPVGPKREKQAEPEPTKPAQSGDAGLPWE
ncbi:MAG: hypothetical protein SFU56_13630 [Capsulimonadales bacterium]|nr:hypothetical protein [Capsulimonadales bacterium]